MPVLARLFRVFLAYFLSFLLIFQPMVGYAGNITVDGSAPASQRAGLDAAQNGVPVVNITAPSAGGVSRNTFSDFNVDSRGVIMNNSLTVGVSQLGGALLGNSNFIDGKTAKIILNEVNGTNRSTLAGATEVFGDRAEYVLANPNGITCNGCGFINTPRVTLSTGAVDVSGGTLNGFNVTSGDVRFEGLDVNALNLDSFDIISRTASFASSVYAGAELNVITGSNYVDYNTKAATPISGSSSAPQVGIDSSALGGMYAGKINLVATEAGVGVNTQGKLGASAGDIKITANGLIEFKDANSKGNIKITSNSSNVKHSGNSYAEGKTEISAAGSIELSDGFTAAKGEVNLIGGSFNNASSASLMAGVTTITSGSNITFTDNGLGLLNTSITGTANNAGSITGSTITINSGSFTNTGFVQSNSDIIISAGNIANNNNYILDSNGSISGGINAGGKLTITSTSGNINNTGGTLTSTSLFTITSASGFINNSLVNGSGNIIINAANIDNSNSYAVNSNGILTSGILASGNINVTTTSGGINNSAGSITGNYLSINSAGQLTNDSGLINSANGIDIASVGVSNSNASILASGDININSGSANTSNTAGVINTSGNIDINHVATFSNTGLVSGASSTSISAYAINNSNSYNTNTNGALTTGILSNGNVTLTAASGSITNNIGAIYGKDIALNATGQFDNTAGLLQATNTASIVANGINNSNSYIKDSFGTLVKGIISTSDITLSGGSGDINNSSGAISSGSKITATTTGTLTNSGLVQSGLDTNITAANLTNSNNLHLDNSGNLDKGILSGGKLTITTTSDIANTNGALYSTGKLTTTSGSTSSNTGLVASGSNISITGSVVNNSGSVITDEDLELVASIGDVSNSGTISADNISITANSGNFNNSSGLSQSSGTTTINSKGIVNNNTYQLDSSGALISGIISTGDLSANVGTNGFTNLNGAVYSAGKADITVTNGSLTNTGLVQSANNLNITAASIDNSNSVGLISSHDINITASNGTIKNITGYIAAKNITAIATGKFDNSSGTVNSALNTSINSVGIDNSDTYITNSSGNIIAGIIAGGTITLTGNAGDIINSDGAVIGTGNITITTSGETSNSGIIQGSNNIIITSGTIDNSNSYLTDSNGTLISGILATGNATITANNGYIKNINGALFASGKVTLNATGNIQNSGLIASGLDTEITAAAIDNSSTTGKGIVAGNNAKLTATSGDINNISGSITGQNITATATGKFDNTGGLLNSPGFIDISASGIDNSSTYILSNGLLTLGIFAGSYVSLNGNDGDILNISGAILATGSIYLESNASISNQAGLINGKADITLLAAAIDNSDSYLAGSSGILQKGILASDQISLTTTSGDINNASGAISASALILTANGDFYNNAGLTTSRGTSTIEANDINNEDTFVKNSNGKLVKGIIANGALEISNGSFSNLNGAVFGASDVTFTSSGTLNNSGLIKSSSALNITAAAIDNSNSYSTDNSGLLDKGLLASGTISITSTTGNIVNTNGAINSVGALTLNSANNLINNSLIRSGSNINIAATSLDNSSSYSVNSNGSINKGILSSNNLTITTTGDITNTNGTFSANTKITFNTTGNLSNSGLIASGADTEINAAAIDNSNSAGKGIIAGNNANLTATNGIIKNISGSITGENITATATGKFDNTGGVINTPGFIKINAVGIDNSNTYLLVNGVLAKGLLASGTITLNGHSGNIVNADGALIAGDIITITADGQITNSGLIQGDTNINITAGTIDNSNSYFADSNGNLIKGIIAGGDANLTASTNNISNNSGTIIATNINITANHGQFNNTAGFSQSSVKTTINSASFANDNSYVTNSSGFLVKGIFSGDDLLINTGSFSNTSGAIIGSAKVTVNGTGSFTNSGLLQSTSALKVSATNLDNSGLLSASTIDLTATANDINNHGIISSAGIIGLTANNGTMANIGLIQGGSNITINAANIDNSDSYAVNINSALTGGIIATGNVIINANNGSINNNSGAIAGRNITATSTSSFTNLSGLVQSVIANNITAANIDNSNSIGIISGADTNLTATSGDIENISGIIASLNLISTSAGKFDNTGGIINTTNAIDISATGIDNSNTYILNTSGNIIKGMFAGGYISLNGNGGDVINNSGSIIGTGEISLTSDTDISNQTGLIKSSSDIFLIAQGSVDNRSSYLADNSGLLTKGILAGEDVTILAINGDINNSSGAISAADFIIGANGNFDNSAGISKSSGTATIIANDITNANTYVKNSNGQLVKGIIANDSISIESNTFSNLNGAVFGASDITFMEDGSFINSGLVKSSGTIAVTASNIDNSNSYNSTNGSLDKGLFASDALELSATSGDIKNISGTMAASNIEADATDGFNNNGGFVKSSGTTIISASSISNDNTYIKSSSGAFIKGIISNGDFTATTSNFSNDNGAILGSSKITVTSSGAFNNSGLIQSSGKLKITAGSIDNSDSYASINGSLAKGLLSSSTIDASATNGAINNSNGAIAGNGDVTISATGLLTNDSLIQSGNNITISAASIDNSYSIGILATGNINLTANSGIINNNAGGLIGNNITIITPANFTNISGLIDATGFINVSAVGINNSNSYLTYSDGSLAAGMLAGTTITLNGHSGDIVNSAGALSSGGNIIISGTAAFTNTGLVQSDADINITTNNIDNSSSYATNSNGQLISGIIASGNTNLTANTGDVNNAYGSIVANNITIHSVNGTFNNTAGSSQSIKNASSGSTTGTTTINANSVKNDNTYVTNTNGTLIKGIISGSDVIANIGTGGFSNSSGAIIGASKITISDTGSFTNSGLVKSASDLSISASAINNNNSYVVANNGSVLKGLVSAGKTTLTANSGNISNSNGSVSSSLALVISAKGQFINNSLIQSSNTITINAASIDNSGSYSVDTNGYINKGIISGSNVIFGSDASQNITLTDVNNSNGAIVANNFTANNSGAFNNNSGIIESVANTNITSASIDNSSSKGIFAGSDINLTSTTSTIKNDAGILIANNINITATNSFSNIAGILSSTRNIIINALGINNSNTYVTESNGALTKGILSGGTISLNAASGDIVNTGGAISNSDDLTITTSGQLINNALIQSDKNINITAGNIDNSGSYSADSSGSIIKGIIAGINASLTSNNGAINNSSGAIIGTNISINSTGAFTNSSGLSQSSGTTNIIASGINNDNSYITDTNGYLVKGIISNGDLSATAGTSGFSNSSGAIIGGSKATITTTGNFTNSGLITSTSALKITAAKIDNSNSYSLVNSSLAKGLISSSTIDLSATAGNIINTNGALSSTGNLTITSSGQLINNSLLQSSANITINSASIDNSSSYAANSSGNLTTGILAIGNINITSGTINNTTGAISANNITVTGSGAFTNISGLVQGQVNTSITATSIDNTNTEVLDTTGKIIKGLLAKTGILTLTSTSGAINNTDGALSSGGNTVINSAGLFSNHSIVQSGGNLNITAGGIDNSNSYSITNGTLTTGLIATGTITLNAGIYDIINEYGGISSGSTFSLSGGNIKNNNGYVAANGLTGTSLIIAASSVANQTGSILSKANLSLSGTSGNNTSGGVISAKNNLTITMTGSEITNNGGNIYSSGGSITGQNINNNSGKIQGANAITITQSNGVFDNRSGTVLAFANGSTVTINAASNIMNQGGNIISIQNTDLNLSSAYTITGNITTGGHVDITASIIANNATVTAGDYINLVTTSGNITNNSGGHLISGTSITLNATGDINNYGEISGPIINLITLGRLSNYDGQITSSGNLNIAVSGSMYNSGRISSQGTATISASSIYNTGSQIASNDTLTITTDGNIYNTSGALLYATNNIILHSGSLDNNYSAYIYSLNGNITLDKTSGVKNSSITNSSAYIESLSGDINIYTSSLTNSRTSYQYVYTPVRNSQGNVIYNDVNYNQADLYKYSTDGVYYEKRRWYYNIKGTNAAQGQIISARDINLNTTSTYNNGSQIAANRNITITGGSITNQAYRLQSWEIAQANYWRGPTWEFNSIDSPGNLNSEDPNYVPTVSVIASSITAGNNISGSISNLNNAVSGSGSASISSVSANTTATTTTTAVSQTSVNNTQLSQTQSGSGISSSTASVTQSQGGISAIDITTAQSQNSTGVAKISASLVQAGISQGNISSGTGINQSGLTSNQSDQTIATINISGGQANIAAGIQVAGVAISTASNNNQQGGASAGNISTTTSASGASVAGVSSSTLETGISQSDISNGAQVSLVSTNTLSGSNSQTTSPTTTQSTQVVGTSSTTSGTSATITSSSSPLALALSLITLPTGDNGLFKTNTAPGSNYLIETNVAFIDQTRLLGSDYFCAHITCPDTSKLIGDSLVVTKLVNQQIFERTGQRYIEKGVGTDFDQIKTLMDNAVNAKSSLGLSVGIELSATQVASLSSDIIWQVDQMVNGQHVLVPVLYLAQATLDGLSGKAATISAGNNLAIAATDSITNSGAISANRDVTLTAGNNITNTGGLIAAGNNVSLTSTNGDIVNQAMVHSAGVGSSQIHEYISDQGNITAGGNVNLNAANDVSVLASIVTAAGGVDVNAGGNVNVDAISTRNRMEYSSKKYSRIDDVTTNTGSTISAGNNVTISAANDVNLIGSNLQGENASITAQAGDINIKNAVNSDMSYVAISKKGFLSSSSDKVYNYKETALQSVVAVNNDLKISAALGDVNIQGSNINAKNNLNLGDFTIAKNADGSFKTNANGTYETISGDSVKNVNISEADLKSEHWEEHTSSGFKLNTLKFEQSTSKSASSSTTALASNLNVGGDLNVNATDNVTVKGSNLSVTGNANINADTVDIKSAQTDASSSKEEKKIELGKLDIKFENGQLKAGVEGSGTDNKYDEQSTTQIASNVSVGGNLLVNSTNTINITASNVAVDGAATIKTGGDFNLSDALDTKKTNTENSKLEVEAGVKVGNAYVDVGYAAKALADATKALAAAKQKLDKIQSLKAEGKASQKAVDLAYLQVTLATAGVASATTSLTLATAGAATAASSSYGTGMYGAAYMDTTAHTDFTKTDSSQSVGSTFVTGGNIGINAANNFNMTGSLLASNNGDVSISAKEANITAGESTFETDFGSKTVTSSVSYGNNAVGMSAGYNQADNYTLSNTHTNSQIVAENGTFSLTTGGDTNIKGGNVTANKVALNIGGNLNLETIQDTYEQQGSSFGINVAASKSVGGTPGSAANSEAKGGIPSYLQNVGLSAGATDIYSSTTGQTTGIVELSSNNNGLSEAQNLNNLLNSSSVNVAGKIDNKTVKQDVIFTDADFQGSITVPTALLTESGRKEIGDAYKNFDTNLVTAGTGAAKTAVLVTPWGANNTITHYTGYTETFLLGGDAAAKPNGIAVINPNKNNIGIAIPLDANGNATRTPGIMDEGGLISTAANIVPGMNSGSVLHDNAVKDMQNYLSTQGLQNPVTSVISNQLTIVPVIAYNYYGLIGQTLSTNILQSFKPAESITQQNKP